MENVIPLNCPSIVFKISSRSISSDPFFIMARIKLLLRLEKPENCLCLFDANMRLIDYSAHLNTGEYVGILGPVYF